MSHLDKCIILDLDETLVHTFGKKDVNGYTYMNNDISLRGRLYHLELNVGGAYSMWSVKRPNVDTFLNYVMDNFGTVIVWSAGVREYVDKVVDWLFTTSHPDKVYARDYCDNIGSSDKEVYVKPIFKLFNEPDLKGKVRYDNTVFVDDNTTSTSYNKDNAVTIPKYHPGIEAISDMNDDALLRIIYWLEANKGNNSDFRTWDKKSIFSPRLKTASELDYTLVNYAYQNIYA